MDVVQGDEGISMVVLLRGGTRARIECPMLIFKNKDSNYPIRNVPDEIKGNLIIYLGVCYRTSPSGFMNNQLMAEWLTEKRIHRGEPRNPARQIWMDNCSSHLKGIKISLNDNEYIYLEIYESRIDLDETEGSVLIHWSWGDSHLFDENEQEYKTIEEMYDDLDMGEWSDWDDMIDSFKNECYDFIKDNCGFGIWFDSQA
jgi:hypothetical protein